MKGLLPLCRGLYTLSNRQARRKAGIVGSRCGFCGTQSNSKVRLELLLRLGSGKQYFVEGSDFFSLGCIRSTLHTVLHATFCQMWLRWLAGMKQQGI